jgi:CO/xanthine dehydrogenase FAD-binding subunit
VSADLGALELLRPRTLPEALRLMRDEGPLTPLAGGTDIFVALHFGTLGARRYLDLWGLRGRTGARALYEIREQGQRLVIGALATYSELCASRLVQRRLPMLVAAAREIGGPQVQNRGTLGGNVVNASPAGDSLPVLAVAEAELVLASSAGRRKVALNAFYTGYRQTVLRPDELLLAIEFPRLHGRQWFRKLGTRQAQAISKVVMAGLRTYTPPRGRRSSVDTASDAIPGLDVRVAFGSVAPTVVRARGAEAALCAGAALSEAEQALLGDLRPIDDVRSTAEYRRHAATRLLRRFWAETATP